MAINNDGRIAILDYMEKTLHIGKVCLEQNLFKLEKSLSPNQLNADPSSVKVMFVDSKATKIIGADRLCLYIYAEDGRMLCKINAHEEYGFIESVAINHVMKRVLVKIINSSSDHSLLSFSETGELIDSLYLGSIEWIRDTKLTSHPNGLVALVGEGGAALLQKNQK
jgi:hypothetical protein